MALAKGDYWAEVVEAETMQPIGALILAGIPEQEERQLAAIAERLGVERERLTLLTRGA